MSPEQAQGKELDARSDLYTLGVLLYQMLVGRAPFVDDDAVVVMARHIKSQAVPPAEAAPDAGIGPALSALVMRALAKDPADRPSTAQAFLAELDRALQDTTPRPTAGISGEVAAVVHDGLGFASGGRRGERLSRARAGLLVTVSAAVVLSAGLFALGAMRPARTPSARAELEHLAASRRLALMQAEAAESQGQGLDGALTAGAVAPVASAAVAPAPPTGPAMPRASTAAPPSSMGLRPAKPAAPGNHYRKFDHF